MSWFDRFRRGAKADPKQVPFVTKDPGDRYLDLAVLAHNRLQQNRALMVITGMSIAFNGYYMTTSRYEPVPFSFDELGHTVVVSRDATGKQVDKRLAIRDQLEKYVENVRTVTGDYALQKGMHRWVENRTLAGSAAERAINELHAQRPPAETARTFTYSVEIKNVFEETDQTYFVEWVERQRNLAGEIPENGVVRWKGRFSLKLTPGGKTYEEVARNPFGFFVTNISWSRTR